METTIYFPLSEHEYGVDENSTIRTFSSEKAANEYVATMSIDAYVESEMVPEGTEKVYLLVKEDYYGINAKCHRCGEKYEKPMICLSEAEAENWRDELEHRCPHAHCGLIVSIVNDSLDAKPLTV